MATFMDVIVTHNNADFDALASLVAASKLYPKAKVVLPSMQERSVRDFLAMIHDVARVENEKSIDFKKMRRLIIVDTRIRSRIGKAQEFLNNPGLTIHCYDHHPRNKYDIAANLDINRKRGATVTLLLEIIKKKKIAISPMEATVFALGIYEDTGSLTFQTTTKQDIDMLSYLFSQGANLSLIASCLNRELTDREMHFLSLMIDATKTFRIAGVNVAISSISDNDETLDLAWITHKLLEIENSNVLFVLVNAKDRVQMIARSRLKSVDVNKIIKNFNGGGHPSAASALIRGKNIAEIEGMLLKILSTSIKSRINARDVMIAPVKTFNLLTTIRQAKKAMDKLEMRAMLVVNRGKLEGIISRNDIDRALRQGYAHAPIKGYMRRKIATVTPNVPVQDVQKIMAEEKLECIPVMQQGKLIGMLSRKDVFLGKHRDILSLGAEKNKQMMKKTTNVIDLSAKIKRSLPSKILKLLAKIGRIADKQGISIFLVGGFVRDLLLSRENFDMDIVVEGNANEFAQSLGKTFKSQVKFYHRFKTAKIKLKSGMLIDIATARTEFYEYPAALPIVESSSLREDLYRRDFTINTLALSLNRKSFGRVIDFFQAKRDIKERRIRVLHDLSFVEDPTRIFRAVRFEQRFDFVIEKHTENLIQAAVDLEMFDRLHKFRIGDELKLLLSEPHPIKVIRRMNYLHELKFIHPGIRFNKKMIELLESVDEVLGWYKLSFFNKPMQQWIIYLLVILDSLDLSSTKETFRNFSFQKAVQDCVYLCKSEEKKIFRIISGHKHITPSALYKIFKPLPLEALLFFMAKTKAMKKKEFFIKFLSKYANIKLKISGFDLKKIATVQGPRFKQALDQTLYAKIDGRITTKSEELDYARRIMCS